MFYKGTFLPPATKLGQGYVFTRVCDSVHRDGVYPSACWDTHTPWADTPLGRHPPWADTSPWADPPGRHTPLPGQTPPWQTPPHSACWDTVNKRAVCILLECNLVLCFSQKEIIWKDTELHYVQCVSTLVRVVIFYLVNCYNFHYLKQLIWSNFTATVIGGTCASEKILWCLGQCWWYRKWNNISEKLWKIPKKFRPAQGRKKQMVHYSRQYERWVGRKLWLYQYFDISLKFSCQKAFQLISLFKMLFQLKMKLCDVCYDEFLTMFTVRSICWIGTTCWRWIWTLPAYYEFLIYRSDIYTLRCCKPLDPRLESKTCCSVRKWLWMVFCLDWQIRSACDSLDSWGEGADEKYVASNW